MKKVYLMLHTIISKDLRWVVNLRIKAKQMHASVHNFKETHKSFFMKCALTFMSVKIGLILLATLSTITFFLRYVTPYLADEMSKTKALLFASPLTMIILLKLYFIGKMLMTYDRSRAMIIATFNVLLLKGGQGMRHIGEVLPSGLSPLSLEKAGNR